eukprot:1653924-Pyramimonas_sp.AAC.1
MMSWTRQLRRLPHAGTTNIIRLTCVKVRTTHHHPRATTRANSFNVCERFRPSSCSTCSSQRRLRPTS